MPENRHAERVILVSLMKSGTHLVKELMSGLGYSMYGHLRVDLDDRPVLSVETRWRIANMVYTAEECASLKTLSETAFSDATDRAWEALAWSWQLRFGIPLTTLYGAELINERLVEQAYRSTSGSSFAETPAGICWVLHDFDIRKIDGNFLREWTETGEPRIIFNYRDPRDTILSLVNFVSGRTRQGLSSFNNLAVFNRILLARESLSDRLEYALTDEAFPCQANDFKRMLWLLNHPDVCKTSFEELVGPNGGGSAESQLRAVKRLMNFLGVIDRSPDDIVDSLFNRDAFSFYRGQIGAWRDVFTAENRDLASARFSEVLSLYGYE